MEYFVCEIIKPIKRRSSKTALNKTKSMNKVLSIHTCVEQCFWQFLRDGRCYHGQDPYSCKEFKKRASEIDLEQIESGLRDRLKDSIVLKYRKQAEQKSVSVVTVLQKDNSVDPWLRVVVSGSGRINKKTPKSICIKCGARVQYPHDPKTLKVTCWLCVAREVLKSVSYEDEKVREANNDRETQKSKRDMARKRSLRTDRPSRN